MPLKNQKLAREHAQMIRTYIFYFFWKSPMSHTTEDFEKNEKERKISVKFDQWILSEHFFPCSFGFFSFEISFVYATKWHFLNFENAQ